MTMPLTDSARQQITAVVDLLTLRLGRNLLAIHLYGSALEGGLRPYSDLDLLVTLRAPLDNTQRASLMPALLALSAPPGAADGRRALEVTMLVYAQLVPWRYPPVRELQFGEWQREDIEAGIYEPAQLDADIAILLTKARHASVALVGDQAARLYPPVPPRDLRQTFQDTLALWRETADLQGDERNIILTLARIWYSVVSGDITGKEEAAAWLLPQLPAEHAATLQVARQEYLGLATQDWAAVMPAVEDFVRYAKAQISARLDE
ncbi:nucleotidyltransferase family protein [Serratia sp. FGI94]|uniref:Aminoglycoside (3'') (9) adenylyltransferase n=1 Tax=Serratia sp. FGI94 TaxID=671990 RepID=L0MJM6_9GAMM|nr:aminoglycoside nucleotidyltransferase [Serratia sp. FGI94]AGB84093.1 nucleotidyltransferase family protein [Serratia sp. FGI94]